LKVLVTDKAGEEYFWATGIARRDGKILGTIDNDPKIVGNVKFGDRLKFLWATSRTGSTCETGGWWATIP
jgi:uncharacterized protein YegJ (DUF2314 family)